MCLQQQHCYYGNENGPKLVSSNEFVRLDPLTGQRKQQYGFDGQNKRKRLHMVAAFMKLAFEQLWLLILLTLQLEGV
jgi:hypothetical protein